MASSFSLTSSVTEIEAVFGADYSRAPALLSIDDNTIVYNFGNFVRFQNTVTGEIRLLEGRDGGGIGAIAVHPSNSMIAVGERSFFNPNIYIYSYPSLSLLHTLTNGTTRGYTCLNFSSDGTRLVSVGARPDILMTVWDWANERQLQRSKAFGHEVYRAAFHPTDTGVLTSCGAGHIRFWEMALTFTGLKLQGAIGKFGKHDLCDITHFEYLSDGIVVSSSENGRLLVWQGGAVRTSIGLTDVESYEAGVLAAVSSARAALETAIMEQEASGIVIPNDFMDGTNQAHVLRKINSFSSVAQEALSAPPSVNSSRPTSSSSSSKPQGSANPQQVIQAKRMRKHLTEMIEWAVIDAPRVPETGPIVPGAISALASCPIAGLLCVAGDDGSLKFLSLRDVAAADIVPNSGGQYPGLRPLLEVSVRELLSSDTSADGMVNQVFFDSLSVSGYDADGSSSSGRPPLSDSTGNNSAVTTPSPTSDRVDTSREFIISGDLIMRISSGQIVRVPFSSCVAGVAQALPLLLMDSGASARGRPLRASKSFVESAIPSKLSLSSAVVLYSGVAGPFTDAVLLPAAVSRTGSASPDTGAAFLASSADGRLTSFALLTDTTEDAQQTQLLRYQESQLRTLQALPTDETVPVALPLSIAAVALAPSALDPTQRTVIAALSDGSVRLLVRLCARATLESSASSASGLMITAAAGLYSDIVPSQFEERQRLQLTQAPGAPGADPKDCGVVQTIVVSADGRSVAATTSNGMLFLLAVQDTTPTLLLGVLAQHKDILPTFSASLQLIGFVRLFSKEDLDSIVRVKQDHDSLSSTSTYSNGNNNNIKSNRSSTPVSTSNVQPITTKKVIPVEQSLPAAELSALEEDPVEVFISKEELRPVSATIVRYLSIPLTALSPSATATQSSLNQLVLNPTQQNLLFSQGETHVNLLLVASSESHLRVFTLPSLQQQLADSKGLSATYDLTTHAHFLPHFVCPKNPRALTADAISNLRINAQSSSEDVLPENIVQFMRRNGYKLDENASPLLTPQPASRSSSAISTNPNGVNVPLGTVVQMAKNMEREFVNAPVATTKSPSAGTEEAAHIAAPQDIPATNIRLSQVGNISQFVLHTTLARASVSNGPIFVRLLFPSSGDELNSLFLHECLLPPSLLVQWMSESIQNSIASVSPSANSSTTHLSVSSMNVIVGRSFPLLSSFVEDGRLQPLEQVTHLSCDAAQTLLFIGFSSGRLELRSLLPSSLTPSPPLPTSLPLPQTETVQVSPSVAVLSTASAPGLSCRFSVFLGGGCDITKVVAMVEGLPSASPASKAQNSSASADSAESAEKTEENTFSATDENLTDKPTLMGPTTTGDSSGALMDSEKSMETNDITIDGALPVSTTLDSSDHGGFSTAADLSSQAICRLMVATATGSIVLVRLVGGVEPLAQRLANPIEWSTLAGLSFRNIVLDASSSAPRVDSTAVTDSVEEIPPQESEEADDSQADTSIEAPNRPSVEITSTVSSTPKSFEMGLRTHPSLAVCPILMRAVQLEDLLFKHPWAPLASSRGLSFAEVRATRRARLLYPPSVSRLHAFGQRPVYTLQQARSTHARESAERTSESIKSAVAQTVAELRARFAAIYSVNEAVRAICADAALPSEAMAIDKTLPGIVEQLRQSELSVAEEEQRFNTLVAKLKLHRTIQRYYGALLDDGGASITPLQPLDAVSGPIADLRNSSISARSKNPLNYTIFSFPVTSLPPQMAAQYEALEQELLRTGKYIFDADALVGVTFSNQSHLYQPLALGDSGTSTSAPKSSVTTPGTLSSPVAHFSPDSPGGPLSVGASRRNLSLGSSSFGLGGSARNLSRSPSKRQVGPLGGGEMSLSPGLRFRTQERAPQLDALGELASPASLQLPFLSNSIITSRSSNSLADAAPGEVNLIIPSSRRSGRRNSEVESESKDVESVSKSSSLMERFHQRQARQEELKQLESLKPTSKDRDALISLQIEHSKSSLGTFSMKSDFSTVAVVGQEGTNSTSSGDISACVSEDYLTVEGTLARVCLLRGRAQKLKQLFNARVRSLRALKRTFVAVLLDMHEELDEIDHILGASTTPVPRLNGRPSLAPLLTAYAKQEGASLQDLLNDAMFSVSSGAPVTERRGLEEFWLGEVSLDDREVYMSELAGSQPEVPRGSLGETLAGLLRAEGLDASTFLSEVGYTGTDGNSLLLALVNKYRSVGIDVIRNAESVALGVAVSSAVSSAVSPTVTTAGKEEISESSVSFPTSTPKRGKLAHMPSHSGSLDAGTMGLSPPASLKRTPARITATAAEPVVIADSVPNTNQSDKVPNTKVLGSSAKIPLRLPTTVPEALALLVSLSARKHALLSLLPALVAVFDAKVHSLRLVRSRIAQLTSDALLRAEMAAEQVAVLSVLSERDQALSARVGRTGGDLVQLEQHREALENQYEVHRGHLEEVQMREKQVFLDFSDLVPASHAQFSALQRLLKRRQKRATGDAEKKEIVFDSDDDAALNEDDLEALDEGDDADDGRMIEGVEKGLLEHVQELRRRRLAIVEELDEAESNAEDAKRACDRVNQRIKVLLKELSEAEAEARILQRQKLAALNRLGDWVILSASDAIVQVSSQGLADFLRESGLESVPEISPDSSHEETDYTVQPLPHDLSSFVIAPYNVPSFLRHRMVQLSRQTDELVAVGQRIEDEDQRMESAKKKLMEDLKHWTSEVKELMTLKFGAELNYAELDRVIQASIPSQTNHDDEERRIMLDIDLDAQRMRRRIKGAKREVDEFTRRSTEVLQKLAAVRARRAAVEAEIEGNAEKGLTALGLLGTIGTKIADTFVAGTTANGVSQLQPSLSKAAVLREQAVGYKKAGRGRVAPKSNFSSTSSSHFQKYNQNLATDEALDLTVGNASIASKNGGTDLKRHSISSSVYSNGSSLNHQALAGLARDSAQDQGIDMESDADSTAKVNGITLVAEAARGLKLSNTFTATHGPSSNALSNVTLESISEENREFSAVIAFQNAQIEQLKEQLRLLKEGDVTPSTAGTYVNKESTNVPSNSLSVNSTRKGNPPVQSSLFSSGGAGASAVNGNSKIRKLQQPVVMTKQTLERKFNSASSTKEDANGPLAVTNSRSKSPKTAVVNANDIK